MSVEVLRKLFWSGWYLGFRHTLAKYWHRCQLRAHHPYREACFGGALCQWENWAVLHTAVEMPIKRTFYVWPSHKRYSGKGEYQINGVKRDQRAVVISSVQVCAHTHSASSLSNLAFACLGFSSKDRGKGICLLSASHPLITNCAGLKSATCEDQPISNKWQITSAAGSCDRYQSILLHTSPFPFTVYSETGVAYLYTDHRALGHCLATESWDSGRWTESTPLFLTLLLLLPFIFLFL